MTPAPSERQSRPPWLTGNLFKDRVQPWLLLIPALTLIVTLTVPVLFLGMLQWSLRRPS